MSYTKQNWQSGDTITANKLNHMEDGIADGGGVLIVNGTVDGPAMTLDHTWQEIYDAGAAILHYVITDGGYFCGLLSEIYEESGQYTCAFTVEQRSLTFNTDSANGYPVSTQG